METKTVYSVTVNTDGTEGRGRNYIKHFCEAEATARRLAYGADVQGSHGTVEAITLYKPASSPRWFGPVYIEPQTDKDKQAQVRLDERNAALKRATDLGLTKDEISLIQR